MNKYNPGRTDKSGNINKEGMKGKLFRTGEELYGDLSGVIHGYSPDPKAYEIDENEPAFSRETLDLLRALKPIYTSVDPQDGFKVDWVKERARYRV